ncbi:MAG: hypothetical protein OEU74_10475, partial [Gammaproteobacteria bacterium]|nr:hypothetical protein [Gammaproteobacteria bacterium]
STLSLDCGIVVGAGESPPTLAFSASNVCCAAAKFSSWLIVALPPQADARTMIINIDTTTRGFIIFPFI